LVPYWRLVVDRAGVVHQRLELRGVAGEPVHQIPAVAGAHRRLARGVDVRVPPRRLADRLQDLLRRTPQDILLDVVRELLSEAVDPV